ncbi:hypothetical protein [Streptomyces niveus]|nr:hypothetical protein [Streptomyces niveus]
MTARGPDGAATAAHGRLVPGRVATYPELTEDNESAGTETAPPRLALGR